MSMSSHTPTRTGALQIPKPTKVLVGPDRYEPAVLHRELADYLAFIEGPLRVPFTYPAGLRSEEDRICICIVRHIRLIAIESVGAV